MSFIYALKAAAAALQATAQVLNLVFEVGQALAESVFDLSLLLLGQGAILLHMLRNKPELLHDAVPMLVSGSCWLLVGHGFGGELRPGAG